MSEDDRGWGAYADTLGDERVLSLFESAEPVTTARAAATVGVTEHTVREKLADLERRGLVGRKRLGESETPLTVWYPRRGVDADAIAAGIDPETTLEARLDAMDFPGTSGMMREWRRDAVRAAYDYLRAEGTVRTPEFRTTVYPAHAAGYDDPALWWDLVGPRLRQLPGVVAADWDGETWRYDPDATGPDGDLR